MKNSVRIPNLFIVLFFIMAFMSIIIFGNCWFRNKSELENLVTKEKSLRIELEQLNTIGTWTLEYVKIEKALAYLSKNRLPPETQRKLTEQLWQIAHSYSTDPLLILAVVAQESHGNPNARGRNRSGSESGAFGLMQIKLETAQKMGLRFGLRIDSIEDLLKPEVNVTVGTAYLMRLIGKYGNWKEALIAYNLGHSAVDRLLERNQPLPTWYYELVISKYRNLASKPFLVNLE